MEDEYGRGGPAGEARGGRHPRESGGRRAAAPRDAVVPGTAARALRVLVVDDDQVDRMALRRVLSQAAGVHEFREADAVLPAIDLLTVEALDCVFLDYNLPDGDGLTFLRGLRAAGIAVPVVMLTGQRDDAVAAQLAEAGAADYIDKSDLTPARLLQALRRALPTRDPGGSRHPHG